MSSQVRIQECSGDCSDMRSSRSISRSTASRALSGRSELFEFLPVLGSGVAFFAEFLLDRFELLTEQVVALGLVDPFGGAVANLLAKREVGQYLAHPRHQLAESFADVERFEQFDFLLEREIGGVDGQVGQLAGVLDSEDPLGHAAHAALVQHLAHDGPVFADQVVERLIVHVGFGVLFGIDPEGSLVVGPAGTHPGPGQTFNDHVATSAS